jgi:membrane-associated phospholipid phosphatase
MKAILALLVATTLAAAPAAAQTTQTTTNDSQSGQTPAVEQQAPSTPPEPAKNEAPDHARTGWATLLKDSASDFVAFPKRKSTWTILGFGAAAALATHPADDYVESHIVGNHAVDHFFSLGQWVGTWYVQVGTAVGLWTVGRYVVAPTTGESKTNKYSEIGFDLIRAQIISQSLVHGMKYSVRRDRPTGECCSFPSGHAASAFAAASVVERHFGYRASWPALVGATYVATSRLVDDRHFLSDVMMGASVGMASGWTVVGTRGRSRQITLQPVPVRGGMMIAFVRDPAPEHTVH